MQGAGRAPVTWILVADGRQAQVYTRKTVERHIPLAGNGKRHHTQDIYEPALEPVLAMPFMAESAKIYQMGLNATGMVFESAGMARHMGEPHIDARKEVKQHFAERIAHFLNSAKMGRAFKYLVLVAPPEMLGEIEAQLNPAIRRKVKAKLPKEFTHLGARDLVKHLRDFFRIP